jgi:hypothetical protein
VFRYDESAVHDRGRVRIVLVFDGYIRIVHVSRIDHVVHVAHIDH